MRHSAPTADHRSGRRRHGRLSILLLLVMPLLLVCLALAINSYLLYETRTTLQSAADASALAAAQALLDDRTLALSDATDPTAANRTALQILHDAREQAKWYARHNAVLGKPLDLVATSANGGQEDLSFGSVPLNGPKDFTPARPADLGRDLWHQINAVHVFARRTRERGNPVSLIGGGFFGLQSMDAVATVTVRIDRHVIGFQPRAGHPVPLVPIALRSDSLTEPARSSWEYQVEKHGGTDVWRYDLSQRRLVGGPGGPESDGLFEMAAHLGTPQMGHAQDVNAVLLQIGGGDFQRLLEQVRKGISVEDLQAGGGKLAFAPDTNRLLLPGTPWGPSPGSTEAQQLQSALEELQSRGECRVWPLYEGIDSSTGMPVISRFVAARVAQVVSPGRCGGLSITLQPCMLSTTTALVDASARGAAGAVRENRYICKVRIVE